MASNDFDPHDLVELRVRGEFVDVLGLVTAVRTGIADFEADFEALDRATKVSTDLAQQVNHQVNFGQVEKELRRLVNNNETIDYRGIEAIVDEFDPRHPVPAGAGVERLTPLDEMEWYIVLGRSDNGFEAAGYPDRLDVERSMLMASFARQYARDLEETAAGPIAGDLPESDDG